MLVQCERMREQIAREIEIQTYRPTAVAFVRNASGEVLLTQSTIATEMDGWETWGMPQGGIEVGEDLETGLRRELKEEVGITAILRITGPFLIRSCTTPHHGNFKVGKTYYCLVADCEGTPQVVLKRDELCSSRWYAPEAAWMFIWGLAFLPAKQYKKELLLDALTRIIRGV